MVSLINRNWVFGRSARLDFSTATPAASAGTAINTGEGCASISDAGGTLLLYTDGQRAWDSANTQRVPTGTNPLLDGNPSSTQSAIIVPNPGSAAQYYIFTADGASGGNKHVSGILIDTITWQYSTVSALALPQNVNFSSTEKITAIQHANCKDFWVVTIVHPVATPNSNVTTGLGTFRVFLVNSTGVQHVGDTPDECQRS